MAMLETTERYTHPTVSSAMEAARMMAPTSRRVSLRSSSVFAITFTAEIDIAVARNRARTVRLPPWTRSGAGSHCPRANPVPKGSRIPSTLVKSAARPSARSRRRSSSRPVRRMRKIIPSQESISSRCSCVDRRERSTRGLRARGGRRRQDRGGCRRAARRGRSAGEACAPTPRGGAPPPASPRTGGGR